MPEIMPANSPPADSDPLPTVVVSKSSSPTAEGVEINGENGDGERPVREQLKKTSIAQMANGTTPPREEDEGISEAPRILATDQKEDTLMENGIHTLEKPSRPLGKRPLPEPEESGTLSPDVMDIAANGHARKKSRDERPTEVVEQEEDHDDSTSEPMELASQQVQEPTSEPAEDAQISAEIEPEATAVTPLNTESVDEEMKERISSPRKKRSRDQFEQESQEREQKVAATEETKSRRRSVELRRSRSPEEAREASSNIKGTELDSTKEESVADTADESDTKSPNEYTGNVKVVSTCGSAACNASQAKDTLAPQTFGQSTQTSSSAFAASGFAALANTSISPFSTLASSKAQDSSTTPSSKAEDSTANTNTANKTLDSKQRVFGSATPIVTLAKEKNKPSTFGAPLSSFASAAPSSGFGAFGASGFGNLVSSQGSAFSSSPFGSGPTKLSSFAAPTGDAKLGTATAVIAKPFGAPAEGDESDESSDVGSEEDEEKRGDEKKEKKEKDGIVDPRFHKQEIRDGEDAEDTIFQSPRAKLYAFTDGKWKERGIGIFKLNVLYPTSDAEKDKQQLTARFIMRAQLTHRLILNMPLFKEMDFQEPQGVKLTFSAMQDGSLVGHVLRIKEEEAKTLYRELKRIQAKL